MAQFRVMTPVAGFTGDVGKVRFTGGVALIDDETDGAALNYCRSAGYTVESPAGPAAEADEAELPKRSASTESWRTWAVDYGGMTAEEVAALSRDQLVERFTSTEETPA